MTSQLPERSDTAASPSDLDPVPPVVVAGALAAFRAVDPDAVVAELVADSLDDEVPDGVAPGERRLLFQAPGLTCVLTLEAASGDGSVLSVVVEPAPADDVLEVQGPTGPVLSTCRASPPGRWRLSPAPTGPVSLTVRGSDSPVRTAWTRL